MIKTIIVIAYLLINLGVLLGLSIYDYKHLMLNKKLFYAYIPISILSIVPNLMLFNMNIGFVMLTSVVSAALIYAMFFFIALVTHNKLGGGDVKLIPFIGFAFGPNISNVLFFMAISMAVLLIVSGIYILVCKAKDIPEEEYKKNKLCGPYPAIPFMFVGCLINSIIEVVPLFNKI